VTMACLTVDPATGAVRAASAGHPAARVLAPDGAVSLVAPRGLALGIETDQRYAAVETTLEPGAALCVFTDGLVEARRDGDQYGEERLLAYAFFLGAALYAGGDFTTAGGSAAASIARWDGSSWSALGLGTELPRTPDATALEAFLVARRRADPLRFPDVPLSVVKMMGAGEYVAEAAGTESAGHFGLAVRDYVHSTAPNRRYPDLVTQRLLKAAIAGTATPYDVSALEQIATHCTMQENAADKVERQVRKSAAALLLSTRLGSRFDAIVTGASPKGTWARALDPPVEGRILHGFEGLDVGDRVQVKLVGVDVERGFIDFER